MTRITTNETTKASTSAKQRSNNTISKNMTSMADDSVGRMDRSAASENYERRERSQSMPSPVPHREVCIRDLTPPRAQGGHDQYGVYRGHFAWVAREVPGPVADATRREWARKFVQDGLGQKDGFPTVLEFMYHLQRMTQITSLQFYTDDSVYNFLPRLWVQQDPLGFNRNLVSRVHQAREEHLRYFQRRY